MHCRSNLIHCVALVPVQSIVKPGAVMRGDLASIRIGRYCSVGENSIIQPGTRIADDNLQEGVEPVVQYTPVLIGDHTVIGTGCTSEAAAIGCCVVIGDNCKLLTAASACVHQSQGSNCIIKDNCCIEEGTVIASGAVVPPFSRVSGQPGRIVEDMPESTPLVHKEQAVARFQHFKPEQ
eukprot:6363-Heterococcus_DN1.PRE.4